MDEALKLAKATCCAYDYLARGPCDRPATFQGVCQGHAVMCAMCGTRLSARGVCEACAVVLAGEWLAAHPPTPPGQVAATPGPAPVEPVSVVRPARRAVDLDF